MNDIMSRAKHILPALTLIILTAAGCAKGDSANAGGLAALFGGGETPHPTTQIPSTGVEAADMISAENGGVIRIGDSITFSVPPGSLAKDTEIKIEELVSAPNAGAGSDFQIAGKAFRFHPAGTQFAADKPAVLRVKYDKAAMEAKGLEPRTMQMFYFDEGQNMYVNVAGGVDIAAGEITAKIEHFTIFLNMAQAKAASGNNLPTALMQGTFPNTPIHGAPLHFRATAHDFLDTDGSIVSVKLFLERTTAGGTFQDVCDMTREVRALGANNTSNTYVCTLPGDFFTAADKGGTGADDIRYYVEVMDNHSGVRQSAIQGRNLDARDLDPTNITITPGTHDMTAGSRRNFTVRVGHTGGGGTVAIVPVTANASIGSGAADILGMDADGILVRATQAGQFTLDVSLNNGILPVQSVVDVFTAGLADCFDIGLTVKCGEIRITDASQNPFTGTVEIIDGHAQQFDVVGLDAFGNMVPVDATVSILPGDDDIGTISAQGVYYALDGRRDDAFGKITATIGGLTTTQFVHVKERTWQDKIGIAAEGSTPINGLALTLRNGVPWVAYAQENSALGEYQIHVRSWTGTTWESHNTSGMLTINPALDALSPDIVNDGNFVYVAWSQGGTIHIRRNGGFGFGWLDIAASLPSNALNIDPTRQANLVKMAVDPGTNNVYVVWQEVTGTVQRIFARRYNVVSGTWDTLGGPVSNSGNFASLGGIAHDGTDVYVTFREDVGGVGRIRVRRFDTLLGWVDVTAGNLNVDPTLDARTPDIAAHGNVPYVTWSEVDGGGIIKVHARRYNAATSSWDLVGGPLNELAGDADNPRIAFDSMGTPYVTFQENDGGIERVLVKHFNPVLGAWRLDTPVEGLNIHPTANGAVPAIAVDGYTPTVIWVDSHTGVNLPYPATLKVKIN